MKPLRKIRRSVLGDTLGFFPTRGSAINSTLESSAFTFTTLTLSANTTIAMWIYFTASITNYNCLWGNDIWYHGSGANPGKIQFVHSATGNCLVTTSNIYNNAAWHFYVITDNGSAVKCYVDNAVDMGNSAAYKTLNLCQTFKLLQGLNANNFKGFIDEVCIWSRALSVNEISYLYNNGLGLRGNLNLSPWNNGLIAGWHLDDLASPAADWSGNGRSGTTNCAFVPGLVYI